MRFDEVQLPPELLSFITRKGFTELYPPQEEAVKAGLLAGKNLVVSSPTACYDGKTEVLTRKGWRPFADVGSNEEVLSMNPKTFRMEYVRAIGKIEYRYSGVMVHVEGKEIEFRVTSNHNMFVRRKDETRKGSHRRSRNNPRQSADFEFRPAWEIRRNWKFKTDGLWKGEARRYIELPPMKVRGRYPQSQGPLPPLRIPVRLFLSFLGWYMAGGNTKFGHGDYEVTLCQRKDLRGAKEALEKLGVARVCVTGSRRHRHFSISCPQLARYLSQFGRAFEKFVPDLVKDLTPDEITVFLDSYGRGDGHTGKDGLSPVFDTTSRRLADDVQELLLKVGISSSVRFRGLSRPHRMPDGHTIRSRHPHFEVAGRQVTEHGIDYRKPCKPKFEKTENEMVYCLTLPKYHLLYVRRNGKAMWCGNSGKTLTAIMAAFVKTKVEGKKVVYLAPLRALASEKYAEFSELSQFGIRSAISTGDYDLSGESLGRADIIVLTNERFDSIMRHRVSWLRAVGLFIADEVHLAGSDSRGPTLEMILTKVMHLGLDAQLLSLSATVSNAKLVGEWLSSTPVELDWRPVPLKQGVFDYGKVVFTDGEERIVARSTYGTPIDVAMDTVKEGGQSLVFAGTRRRAVSLATKAAELTQRFLGEDERRALSEASRRILTSGEEMSLSRLLAEIVAKGAAFHHAGLEAEHRRVVEDYYRARALKVIAATPTLALGVNLPARRVVIADTSRYDVERGGNSDMSVLEYRQMAGRAGRPQYDDHGETVLVPPPSQPAREVLAHYASAPPEPVESRLSDEAAMRTHTLATVATSAGLTKKEIQGLFGRTLLAFQIGEGRVGRLIESALGYLLGERLVESKADLFQATDFGRRVSILYIDPVTGVQFREALKKTLPGRDHTTGFLYSLANCPDFEPKFPLRSKDYDAALAFMEEHSVELLTKPSRSSFAEFDEVLQGSRTVMALHGWIDEWREEQLLTRLGVEPGDMHRAVDNADWLLHSMAELAKLFKRDEAAREAERLRKRVESGVAEELVELTTLQGVGRVRARSLYSAGFRTLEDLKEAPADRLALVEKVGTSVARRIKEQVSRL